MEGFKNVRIPEKITSLQWSWVKTLYDDSFHERKISSLRLIKNVFGNFPRFHSYLAFKRHNIKLFLYYYRNMLSNWKRHFF